MRKTRQTILAATAMVLAAVGTASCTKGKFHVDGSIASAKDSTLYFEHNALNGFSVIDSVKLDEEGRFSFSGDQATTPEFYRLRIAGQIINVAIDSTETVTVEARYPMMATEYSVKGSYENEKIKELALRQIDLQSRCQAVADDPRLGVDTATAVIRRMIEAHKDEVKRQYIYKEPMRAYSYFALFQYITVNGYSSLLFNTRENEDDVKAFGAVATSWDTYYPGSERGKNLHNIALQGMKENRIVQNRQQLANIDATQVTESDIIDLPLLDNKGHRRSLKELKGKVVMLDFHVFSTGEESMKRIMSMRDLYNKYHDRGFEIYQVSLDNNEHFWKSQTAALPWVSVIDPDGLGSANLVKYNVQSIPTFFLIDRNNILQKRDTQIQDLDAAIQSLL